MSGKEAIQRKTETKALGVQQDFGHFTVGGSMKNFNIAKWYLAKVITS